MKDKSSIIFISILSVLTIIFTLIFLFAPKKVDWKATFYENDKNPYGDYVLYKLLPELFPNQTIEKKQRTLYEELDYYSFDDQQNNEGNYVMISNNLNISEYDLNALLQYVQVGNTVFMAARNFSNQLTDTLKFDLKHSYYDTEFTSEDFNIQQGDELSLNFVNPTLKRKDNFYFKKGTILNYINKIDSTTTTILGLNSLNQITYVKIKYGYGNILVSTTPLAFTNYNMLYRGNEAYIERAFSYLPQKSMYWDSYYKPFNNQMREGELSFIMNQAPLKWAWYLTIFSAILYVIFNMRRVQRIIPILEPAKNSTLEFVRTVSQLYYQRGNHKDIVRKKIHFFYDYIRSYYYLNPNQQDDLFFRKLAGKTGQTEKEVYDFFNYLSAFSDRGACSEQDLKLLNQRLNEFKYGRK